MYICQISDCNLRNIEATSEHSLQTPKKCREVCTELHLKMNSFSALTSKWHLNFVTMKKMDTRKCVQAFERNDYDTRQQKTHI